jgi:hypothetical protein
MNPEILKDLDWLRSRKMNYQQFSENDIGHIYDILQCIVDQAGINLKHDDSIVLEHRKRIKTVYPKPPTN